MTKEKPEDILGKLRDLGVTKPTNSVDQWIKNNKEIGKLFIATMELADTNGEQLTPVIDYFKRTYEGPPGNTCTVRRAFRSWQKQNR